MQTVRELLTALIAPGWAQWSRRRRIAVLLLVLGVGLPIVTLLAIAFSGRTWVAMSLDRTVLAWIVVAMVAALGTRLAAVALWWNAEPRSGRRSGWAAAASVAVTVPMVAGIVGVAGAREDIAPVFTPTADDEPLYSPESVTTVPAAPSTVPVATSTSTTIARGPLPTVDMVSTTTTLPPPLPARPRSGVDPDDVADVYNILLLGGDAGPGRSGLRTDTMMILSVHTPSGRAGLVSLPRDMKGLLFPPGSALERRYPYGFTDLANAVYPIVSANASLRDAYTVDDIRPGVVAIAQAIGYSLDIPIHDYVLIDMQGFLQLIDALGGVTVNVTKQIPMPGNVPGAPTQYPDTIGPGVIHMDGSTALGYVRSRHADSDYQRTRRQRELLAALAQQISLADVIARYTEVVGAVGGTLRTSLSPDELADTLALVGGETAIVESVGLVPPLVNVRRPDFQQMAEIVGAVRLAIATDIPSGY